MTAEFSMVQALEQRMLLSGAHPVDAAALAAPREAAVHVPTARPKEAASSYNLMNLFAYDKLGAQWTYRTRYTARSSEGSDSGSGTQSVNVGRQTVRIDGHNCDVVTIDTPETSQKYAWYSDSSGTYCTLIATDLGMGKLELKLHDTRVAPRSLSVGRTYSDKGTFDGTFTISGYGQSIVGKVGGSVAATSRLAGTETVKVAAGRFSAVKGQYELTMSGKMTIRYQGRNYTANFSATASETFWAVPGTGMVKSQDQMSVYVSMSGESERVTVTSNTELTGSSLVKTAARAPKAAAVFADRPIIGLLA